MACSARRARVRPCQPRSAHVARGGGVTFCIDFVPESLLVTKLTYAAMGSMIDVRWAWRLLIAMVLSVPAVMSTADPDLWGHTRFGLDMLETQRIPPVDRYSFTQDVPWI